MFNLTSAAIFFVWANALFIVALTMTAYKDSLQRRMSDAHTHLQLAGVLALVTAVMASVVLYEQKAFGDVQTQKLEQESTNNSSWNAYPPTASR
jgi:hypothetical protein